MEKRPKNKPLIMSEIAGQLPEEMTFQSKLRMAVFDGVKEVDVTKVVEGIVERAKAGDEKSVQHLFDYILGAKAQTKLVQNNFYGDDRSR
jgi:hypothetical protein